MKTAAKKIVVGIVGGTVLLIGLAMVVLPGPAFLVIPAGLAILATEFVWAHRMKEQCGEKFREWRDEHRRRKAAKKRGPVQVY